MTLPDWSPPHEQKPAPEPLLLVEFVLEAEDMRHLTRLVNGIRRVPGGREVQRAHKV